MLVVQRENLTYEWNDVALLVDQRAYTVICKTMLKLSQRNVQEIQDVVLWDWTWKHSPVSDETERIAPFQGDVILQLQYLNQDFQRDAFFVDLPIQGAWHETLIQQNSMQLIFSHTQIVEEHLLLETVLQIVRNQELAYDQVLLGSFQLEEVLSLETPWPPCDNLLTTSVTLLVEEWKIFSQVLQLEGVYHLDCIYQSTQQIGEQIFVYEQRVPMKVSFPVPDGFQELSGVMAYYQNIATQILDTEHIQITGSGVFCTLPNECQRELQERKTVATENELISKNSARKKDPCPSVIHNRGSRKADLSKHMRNLNNSVESASAIRNIEFKTAPIQPD